LKISLNKSQGLTITLKFLLIHVHDETVLDLVILLPHLLRRTHCEGRLALTI
jgi:hypothetical protein